MKKRLMIISFSCLLTLTACGGDDELQKGISAYENGDYETAYEFFKEKTIKDPSKDATSWLKKTEKVYSEEIVDSVNKAWEEVDIEKAYKLVKIAIELNPTDEDIQKAAVQVETAYNEQQNLNQYTSYLNDIKGKVTQITDTWNDSFLKLQTNQITVPQFIDIARQLQPQVASMARSTEDIGYTLKEQQLKDVNNMLYEYLFAMDSQLSRVITSKEFTITEVDNYTNSLKANIRKETFDSIKNSIDAYVNETDMNENKRRNIKNTLNF